MKWQKWKKVAKSTVSLDGEALGRYFRGRVDKQGRLVIPAAVREQLGIGPATAVTVWTDGQEMRMTTVKAAMKQVQYWAARFKKPGESVVDEFLRERREEAARE